MTLRSPTRIALAALTTLVSSSRLRAQESPVMFRFDAAHSGSTEEELFRGQGGVRWRFQTGGAVRSTPAVTASRLYAGSGDGFLYALDRMSGKLLWRFDAGAPVHASPAVAHGLVFAATMSGRMFAVDQATGGLRWSITAGAPLPLNHEASAWDYFVSSPVLADSMVIFGGHDGVVYALAARSGAQRWKARTGGRVRATAAIAGGLVVVGSFDGRMYAFDLINGKERWVFRTIGDTLDSEKAGYDRRAIQSSAAVARQTVFFGSRDDGLYALNLATGAPRWRISHRTSWVVGSPAVRDGRVYVGSSDGHFVQALEGSTSREIWRRPVASNALASPLLAGTALLVATRADAPWGDLLALEAATGAVRWKLRMSEAIIASPVLRDGVIYLGLEDGGIVAVEEVNPKIPHLAVFHDSTMHRRTTFPGSRLLREYLEQSGYRVLDRDSLLTFLSARIADRTPSVVVFAHDVLPPGLEETAGEKGLIRDYLEAGGKIIWPGRPIGAITLDSAGRMTGFDLSRTERLIGVPYDSKDYSEHNGRPTTEGARWGISAPMRGNYGLRPSAVTVALATDEAGKATAWLQRFGSAMPGAGFVQLWGLGATAERLPLIRAVAEYGLLRPSSPDGS